MSDPNPGLLPSKEFKQLGKSMTQWQKDVHSLAVEKGWWENWDRPFSEIIANLHDEVSEMWQEYVKGNPINEVYYKVVGHDGYVSYTVDILMISKAEGNVDPKPLGIPSEAADLAIRLMDFCERHDIDLEAEIARKHEYNKTRSYRHGNKLA